MKILSFDFNFFRQFLDFLPFSDYEKTNFVST